MLIFAVFTNFLIVIGKSKRVKKMIQYFSRPLLVGPDMKENGRMELLVELRNQKNQKNQKEILILQLQYFQR